MNHFNNPVIRQVTNSLPLTSVFMASLSVIFLSAGWLGDIPMLVLVISAVSIWVWWRRRGRRLIMIARAAWKYPGLDAAEIQIVTIISAQWSVSLERLGLTRNIVIEKTRLGDGSGKLFSRLLMQTVEREIQPEIPKIAAAHKTAVGLEIMAILPPGISVEDVAAKSAALADAFRIHDLTVHRAQPGVVALGVRLRDPLKESVTLHGPYAVKTWAAVHYGHDEFGNVVSVDLRNRSGLVVGGLPGGGKTAGLTTLLTGLAMRQDVQFAIFDGKGGADWQWISRRASIYNRNDEDLASVADELGLVVAEMRYRARTLKERRGHSNIWETGGPSADLPLLVVVVDECQTFFDTKGMTKEDKASAERITAHVQSLVKKGRSVGVLVIPTTQKPTADSLPTGIRDNAALRIAFRVISPTAEEAILGDRGQPSPTDLPDRAGMAVVMTESGERKTVRFDYLPEAVAEQVAINAAHLRRDLIPPPPLPETTVGANYA